MTDDFIISIIYPKTRPSRHFLLNKSCYPNIVKYIESRYNDSSSFRESLDRMKLHIETRPVCKNCGKSITYRGNGIYSTYCSKKCSYENTNDNRKKNIKLKYGVDNIAQNESIKTKIKQTCLHRYGITNGGWSKNAQQKIKATNIKKYGVEMPLQSKKIQQKAKNKQKIKYGVEHYMQSEKFRIDSKKIFLEKYGVDCPMKCNKVQVKLSNKLSTEEVKQKIYNTKKKNHSFNISKPEEELYLYIKEKFPNVNRQYKDKERYPYCCDFYIPELDCFIELQGIWTHGQHPFSSSNKDDLHILECWKKKVEEGHKFYGNAIKTWTVSDVKKRETARRNNLNFHEFWNLESAKEFINSIDVV